LVTFGEDPFVPIVKPRRALLAVDHADRKPTEPLGQRTSSREPRQQKLGGTALIQSLTGGIEIAVAKTSTG
jgi:hypothetical protein